jgi:adenine-specific DNA-methyltransferase
MQNLLDELTKLLSEDERLVSEGKILKNKVIELALNLDAGLIKLLLKNESIKRHFFAEVGSVLVFDKIKFQRFVSNKQFLPDSYTAFKNKIGLVNENGDYLSESREVVLAWPYKDCVLEGGQTKEDQKRDEIFWNETLAPDEIDRLLAPKVFTNFKRYDKNGEHALSGNEKVDFSKENLIIKGNNLFALHSLYKRFAGKVKLIYIDPPYNRDADSFYNDSFKQSSWLTFMSNRIEKAYDLLKKDGLIFIQIDDTQLAYLKVLCDEVLGKSSFLNCIAIKMSESTGKKMAHADKRLPKLKEYILVYKKDIAAMRAPKIPKENWDSEYKYFITNISDKDIEFLKDTIQNDGRSQDDIIKCDNILAKMEWVNIEQYFKTKKIDSSEQDKFKYDNSHRIIRTVATSDSAKNIADKKKLKFTGNTFSIITPQNKMYIMLKDYDSQSAQPRARILFADDYLTKNAGDFWGDINMTGLEPEGGVTLLNGKKPEELINRIIKMSSDENDIVLDYHLGSGTTAAVAHKMGRQYLGVEQLDYGENDSVVRLQNVIKGDQSGISKSVNWQGGGSFLYCELMEYNEAYIDRIRKAKTTKELLFIWKEMQEKAFISYKIDPKNINANISEFERLSLDEQKRFLIETLDKNQLYVHYSEIDDEDYKVSDTDKKINKMFYGEK